MLRRWVGGENRAALDGSDDFAEVDMPNVGLALPTLTWRKSI
jgi:hypothetical protein